MEITLELFGDIYECRDFCDVLDHTQVVGVEISNNGNHLGTIVGISVPDENDDEEMKHFENEVIDWLVENT